MIKINPPLHRGIKYGINSAMVHASISSRIHSIDALRGLVMLLMLADHVREFFYIHQQVADPMVVESTDPWLFWSRFSGHICAPVFVFLSGLSARLYSQKHGNSRADTSRFLLSRGLILLGLELTIINFGWTFAFPPSTLYLQVIWAIGASMVILSGLVWLPRAVIIAFGLLTIGGHNLLTPIDFAFDSPWYIPWALLHDRSLVAITDHFAFRTSYPLLPWCGIMALGYGCGRIFLRDYPADKRQTRLLWACIASLALFVALRSANLYGEASHWQIASSGWHSLMSFFNVTKYPASLLFVLLTLGIAAFILRWFGHRNAQPPRWIQALTIFGKAPLFFYIVHLYVLNLANLVALQLFGATHGNGFNFSHPLYNWLFAITLTPLLYVACRWFLGYQKRNPHKRWLSYL